MCLDEYYGIKWYPDRKGYWLGTVKGKPVRLHRYVWEKYNGKIPKGYHVHHIDHNPDNNDIANLQLLSSQEHLSMHGNDESNIAKARKNVLIYANPAAAKWHASSKGHTWHVEHYQKTLADKWNEKITKTCEICGKTFETSILMKDKSRFCSNACKSQYRRNMKFDDVTKNCVICGKPFQTNQYSPGKYCSSDCRNIGRKITMQHRRKNIL